MTSDTTLLFNALLALRGKHAPQEQRLLNRRHCSSKQGLLYRRFLHPRFLHPLSDLRVIQRFGQPKRPSDPSLAYSIQPLARSKGGATTPPGIAISPAKPVQRPKPQETRGGRTRRVARAEHALLMCPAPIA